MNRSRIEAGVCVALAALCLALSAGCGRAGDERRDRHLRRARAAKDAQDIDRAIELCDQALRRHPDLASAHREMGLMLHHYRGDHVGAIYHYQRYLKLRPDASDREEVEGMIRECRLSYAGQIAESPEEVRNDLRARDQRIQALEREVAGLRAQTQARASAPLAAEPARVPAAAPSSAAAPERVHVVQAGENLATISERYFGTRARWKDIFNANQDRLTDANNLRVGTRIAIPAE